MCDYSLHTFPNRLAVDGEDLVVHRFGGASLGLASPADVGVGVYGPKCESAPGRTWSWSRIKAWFQMQSHNWEAEKRVTAVCVPPGAKLILRDIPKSLQRELGVSEVEEVTFIETSAQVNTYRDAVRFKNSRQILLQGLREGQRVTIVSTMPEEAAPAQTPFSELVAR